MLTIAFFWRCLFTSAVFLPTDLVLRLQPWRAYSHDLFPDFRIVYNPLLDAVLLFYPWRVFAARTMAGGHVPLWNPHSFCGQPFLANVSSAVLYPPNILFYLADPAKAYGYTAALHVFLAGAFTYLFLRVLEVRASAAMLGAVTFMFCGFLTVWAQYQTPVAATIWLPLALYFWERHARGHGRRFAVYATAPLGLSLLGGHLQYSSYVLLCFGVYAAWRSGLRPRQWIVAGAVLAAGVALAAHQVLPSLELARYNHRSDGQPLSGVLASGLPLRHLITFLVPNFLGNCVDYNYWSTFNFVEYCGYLGLLPLLLAPAALWLRRDRHTWFFAALAVVTLLMILGTPLYAPLYYLVPGFKQLNNPARMMGIFALAVACLGALGADSLAGLPAQRRRPALAGIAGAILLACVGVAGFYTMQSDAIREAAGKVQGVLPNYIDAALLAFLLTALAAGVAAALAAGRPKIAWTLPLLAAADLFLFGMRFNPAGDPRMLFFPTESVSYLKSQPGHFRVLALPSPNPSDFMNSMIPNCNLPAGLSEVQGGDALYPRRFREFAEFVESRKQGRPVRIGNGLTFSSPDTPGLDFLNAAYVLSPGELKSPRLELVSSPDLHLYRNRAAKPRALLVHRSRVEPVDRVLDAMAEEDFALDRVAVLEQAPANAPAPASGTERAEIVAEDPGQVRVEVQASSNALLVLADQHFPGWRATVDGTPCPILAANYIMRAVPVPAGKHVVEFSYQPTTFRLGLYFTLAALALLAARATGAAAARRRPPAGA